MLLEHDTEKTTVFAAELSTVSPSLFRKDLRLQRGEPREIMLHFTNASNFFPQSQNMYLPACEFIRLLKIELGSDWSI